MMKGDRLYFVTRTDISEGRRTAMVIHAMDRWSALYGPHNGTVIVYQVPNEDRLLELLPESGRTALWREPDLGDEATAFATDIGRMDLPLLGRKQKKCPSSSVVEHRTLVKAKWKTGSRGTTTSWSHGATPGSDAVERGSLPLLS